MIKPTPQIRADEDSGALCLLVADTVEKVRRSGSRQNQRNVTEVFDRPKLVL